MLFACQLLTAGKTLFKKWLLVILNFSFFIPQEFRERKERLFALHKK